MKQTVPSFRHFADSVPRAAQFRFLLVIARRFKVLACPPKPLDEA
jgi:hypothetical protein